MHARPIADAATCKAAFSHDFSTEIITILLISGLVVSYLPQHYRIIAHRSSEGFSPSFLLLGSTSAASSLLCVITLQWGQILCCRYLSAGQCFESLLGVAQVFLVWFCFTLIFVLYLIFYPSSGKYVRSLPLDAPPPKSSSIIPAFFRTSTPQGLIRRDSASSVSSEGSDFDPSTIILPGQVRHSRIHLSPEYRIALSLFGVTMLHLFLCGLTTFILVLSLPNSPHEGTPPAFPGGGGGKEHPSERAVRHWSTAMGMISVGLGCAQYFPQLLLTAQKKLVGSLSIPMMLLQAPGSFLFCYTLAIRPGVNWTGWATYFITGILQGTLLVLCLIWKRRQAKLGIDDWGVPLVGEGSAPVQQPGETSRLLG